MKHEVDKTKPLYPSPLRDLYKIKRNTEDNAYYDLTIEMDSNDGDYISSNIGFPENGLWKEMPDFFFLMLAYLARGYSGKFSHGEQWGDYYGHHWMSNKHGFSDMIEELDDYLDNEFILGDDYGWCHSFSGFELKYHDTNNTVYPVDIPNIDDMFDTEEELIAAMNRAYEDFVKKL